jgi:hypothetical protein
MFTLLVVSMACLPLLVHSLPSAVPVLEDEPATAAATAAAAAARAAGLGARLPAAAAPGAEAAALPVLAAAGIACGDKYIQTHVR